MEHHIKGTELCVIGYEKNSCYCDTAIYALLYQQNDYIEEKILHSTKHHQYIDNFKEKYDLVEEIRRELELVYNKLHTKRETSGDIVTMSHLRELLSEYILLSVSKNISLSKTQQSREFEYYKGINPSIELLGETRGMTPQKIESMMSKMWKEISVLIEGIEDVVEIMNAIKIVHEDNDMILIFNEQTLSPLDIYTQLFDIFDLDEDVNISIDRSYINTETEHVYSQSFVERHRIIVVINGYGLSSSNKYELDNLLTQEEVTLSMENYIKCGENGEDICNKIVTHKTIVHAPMLIIHVAKSGDLEKRPNVWASDTIRTLDGNQLRLSCLIVFLGESEKNGHYISYVRISDNWYLYDDIFKPSRLRCVHHGSMRNFVSKNKLFTQSVYYIYT